MSSIILWFSVPADEVDHPTTEQLTAWEVAAGNDIEALIGKAYDSTVAKEQRLFRMLCANYLYYFYKIQNRMAASLSMGGAAASYQSMVPFFSRDEINAAVDAIVREPTGTGVYFHLD